MEKCAFFCSILNLCLPVSACGYVFCSHEYFVSPFSASPSSSLPRCFHPFIHPNPLAKRPTNVDQKPTTHPQWDSHPVSANLSASPDYGCNLQEQMMFGHQEKQALPMLCEELLGGIPKDMQNVDILLDVALARKFAIQSFWEIASTSWEWLHPTHSGCFCPSLQLTLKYAQ